jgi:hypothetical protein
MKNNKLGIDQSNKWNFMINIENMKKQQEIMMRSVKYNNFIKNIILVI